MPAPPSPPLELEGPAGQRLTVAPSSPDDRIGELADALGLDPRRGLSVDGRSVGRHETLARAGLVRGSRLEPEADRPASTAEQGGSAGDAVRIVGEAGPAAGVTTMLGPGSHVVGRALTSAVRIADPAVEPHHGLLDVADDGTVRFVQLSGRVPARVAGEPIAGSVAIGPGTTLHVGTSRLRIAVDGARESPPSTAVLTPTPGDPWRRTLRRPPRALLVWAPEPVAVPSATTPPPRPSWRRSRRGRVHVGRLGPRRRGHEVADVPPPRRGRRARLALPLAHRPRPRRARQSEGDPACASGSSRRSGSPSPSSATPSGGTFLPPRRPLPTRSPPRPRSAPTCGPAGPITPTPSR